MSTPVKYRHGAKVIPIRNRTPLSVKRVIQLSPDLSALLGGVHLDSDDTWFNDKRSGRVDKDSEWERRPDLDHQQIDCHALSKPRPHHLPYHIRTIHYTSLPSYPLPEVSTPPTYPVTPIRPHKTIITSRYFIKDKILARLYYIAAMDAATHAAARAIECVLRPSINDNHSPLIPSPLHQEPFVLPPTPSLLPGSSPFVKAQRRIHHIRYGSVEVRGKARTLREQLLRKRAAI